MTAAELTRIPQGLQLLELGGSREFTADIRKLLAEREELLAALKAVAKWMECGTPAGRVNNLAFASKAIAKATT